MTISLTKSSLNDINLKDSFILKLESLVLDQIKNKDYPACQIAISRFDRLGYFKTFGLSSLDPIKYANDNTLF